VKGQDKFEHSIEECIEVRDWFKELGRCREERLVRIWSDKLDEKDKILKKLRKKRRK